MVILLLLCENIKKNLKYTIQKNACNVFVTNKSFILIYSTEKKYTWYTDIRVVKL